MLTPAKYWRVAADIDDSGIPPAQFLLPAELSAQATPPSRGHGLCIAPYDQRTQTGLLRWLGIVSGGSGDTRTVDWREARAEIWVDTATGRRFWEAGAFGFAPNKPKDYGLHELWQAHFDDLELRASAHSGGGRRASGFASNRRVAPERLEPVEVIGEPGGGIRSGVVYVLKSAFGFKVGRTGNMPARMRTFGIQLPFAYTIPLCAWFDDCHVAEKRYHDLFSSKLINGEWFDLSDLDIDTIRRRL